MLELLAGPFLVTKNGLDVDLDDASRVACLSPFGLFCNKGTTSVNSLYIDDTFGIVQIDGTYVTRAASTGPSAVRCLFPDHKNRTLYRGSYNIGLDQVDPTTGLYHLDDRMAGDWNEQYSMAVVGGRIFRSIGSALQASPLQGTPAFVTEATLGNSSAATLSSSATDVLYVGKLNGEIQVYDTVSQTQMDSKWIDTALGAAFGIWYFDKYDVFLSLHKVSTQFFLRVWANAPKPASLSEPTPLTALLKGKLTTFRAQLLGSNGEACSGETVTWSLVGNGSLLDTQTKTDQDGYATTRYVAPVDSLPSIEVTAEVRF